MRNASPGYVLKSARFALCLALWAAPSWCATLELLSLNDLISKSTSIVQAQVTAVSASFSGSLIYTHYSVNVQAQWKGPSQTSIDVLVPGGAANGVRQICPGVPQLTPGQQYVLFLWKSSQGRTLIMGFTQGVFSLQGAAGNLTAVQMPSTETVLSPNTGLAIQSRPISMPLSQLISAITAGGTN